MRGRLGTGRAPRGRSAGAVSRSGCTSIRWGSRFVLLFLLSWLGHAWGGWADYRYEKVVQGHVAPSLQDYVASSRFWFESLQNWQSEFLSIAAMVWLAVYLRQRY
jgi:hypothetical protein